MISIKAPWTPCLSVRANPGKSGRASREKALRLAAVRPARLEPSASSAADYERMVADRAAASGEKRMDLSEGIAWFGNMPNFGDILNMDGPRVEIGPRAAFGNSVVGGWQYSQRGMVRARPDPAGLAWGVERKNSGQWPVNAKPGRSR